MIDENENTEPTTTPTAPPATEASAPEEEVIELPTYPGDPYGIKAVCAKYELYPLTPTYIPEGFKIVRLIENDDSKQSEVIIRFKRGEEIIMLEFSFYKTENTSVGIPCDSGHIQEVDNNGHIFSIIKEDNQFKAFNIENNLFISMQSFDVDYNEMENVFYSMK